MPKPPSPPKQTQPTKTATQPVDQKVDQKNSTGLIRTEALQWQGPIPPPAALEHVDRVVPGGADRILKMAEQEQVHRIELEKMAVVAEIKNERRSKLYGLLVALVALGGAITNVSLGGPWQATAVFLAPPILGVVNVLIAKRK